MRANQGIEALAVLQAGPLQGLGRGVRRALDARQRLSHRLDLDTAASRSAFQLQDIDGFNITDAAGLPDGGLLVLERYFRWTEGVKMRIRRIRRQRDRAGRANRPGARCSRRDSSYEIDNMEGLAVHRGSARRDRGVADLRRQLQPLPAAHDVPAVHAGRAKSRSQRHARHDPPSDAPSTSGISSSRAISAWSSTCMAFTTHASTGSIRLSNRTSPSRSPISCCLERAAFGSPRKKAASSARSQWWTPKRGWASCSWFLLTPEARGTGLGRRMLETALAYCRERGMHHVFLWSFAQLDDALRLYERAGFQVTETNKARLWGAERTEVRMDLKMGTR